MTVGKDSISQARKTLIPDRMKTVAGKVHSTIPISLSKAASILSKFVSADTGASQAVCAYLRRASASFNELNQLHKELKSRRKHKTPKRETIIEDEKPKRSVISNQQPSHPEWSRQQGRGVGDGGESESKKHKKNKKDERGWFVNTEKIEVEVAEDKLRINNEEKPSQDVESNLVVETGKKKKAEVRNLEESNDNVKIEKDGNVGMGNDRKTQEQNGVGIGYLEEDKHKIKIDKDGDMGTDNERKKHKKQSETSRHDIGNLKKNGDGVVIEEEEEEEEGKKKSEEFEEVKEMNTEESRSKKKKRKRKSDEIEERKEMITEDSRSKKKKRRRKNEGQSN